MIIPYLSKNVIDKPNQRSSHEYPKPSAGGLSFVISGILFSILKGYYLPLICLPLSLVGFVDDLRNLKRSIRFFAQLVTVLMIIYESKFIDNFDELGNLHILSY